MAPYNDGLLAFLFRQLFYTIPEVPPVELHGKSVLVTGANSGVGFCLALELASHGAKVLAAVRSVPKGEAAKQRILERVPTAQVDVQECDLASFDSVKAFANQMKQESKTFDLVILNAGVWCSQWMASTDGFDISLQVNVLSNALLTMLILPHLRYKSGKPRIVFVTSEGHAMVPTHFMQHNSILDTFKQSPESFDHYTHYYTSKLFGLLWALALSRRIDREKFSVVLASPGLCKSELFRHVRSAPTDILANCFARSCDEGARMIMIASVQELAENSEPSYYSQGSLVPVSRFSSSAEGLLCQDRLWQEVASTLVQVDPDFEAYLQLAC
ncbi:hypothetical protein BDV35DRAFT_402059 [Aspergillus flavus]|uniref:Short-chain dehydrogenase/reductase SDR n=3 Tax=Aspergillus subgen. Circumdati TaxID=2720871 RepID=A0A1S9DSN2_ASPOZ|nr:hypothetical protein BDV35DRAFT_402059 [Aspergillus flavus]OOO12103.1 short-chain dehydrogenase/reductase SDR [Aspergillus oryzae]RMZ36721.1 short-chain dehydrogenase [Aspergillus flavus]